MFLSFFKGFFQWELWTFLVRGLRKFRNLRRNRSHFVKSKVDQTVSEYTECCKLMNPSIYGSEIRQRLLFDGVVHPADVSQINRVSHTQHAMTRKRITVVPRESTTPTATEAVVLSLTKFQTLGHQSYIFSTNLVW